jgi:hypothetical protein
MFATSNPYSLLGPDTPSPPSRNKPLLQSTQNRKRPPPSENVTITYQVRLPDTAGRTVVKRHTPIPDIAKCSPIKNLAESFGAAVEVSPARSACSETDVHINTDLQSLISFAKTELRSESQVPLNNAYERIRDLERRVRACESVEQRTSALETDAKRQAQGAEDIEMWKIVGLGGTSFEEWNRKTKRQTEFVNRIATSACMRSVEDWCFQRMRKVMGLKESEILTHEALVDQFLSKYIPVSCEPSHLLSLKSTADRRSLNATIHLSRYNEEDIKLIRDTMCEALSNEDAARFLALLDFGRGISQVHARSGR